MHYHWYDLTGTFVLVMQMKYEQCTPHRPWDRHVLQLLLTGESASCRYSACLIRAPTVLQTDACCQRQGRDTDFCRYYWWISDPWANSPIFARILRQKIWSCCCFGKIQSTPGKCVVAVCTLSSAFDSLLMVPSTLSYACPGLDLFKLTSKCVMSSS